MSQSLQGKIAVITGAASGIGLASTEALLAQGATVVMVDRNEAALKELVAKFGDKAVAQVTDLLDPASCSAMVPEILQKVDHIDILYCNAGSYIGGDLTETTPEAIDRMLNLNVNAVIKNVHAVVPHMSERKTGDISLFATGSIAAGVFLWTLYGLLIGSWPIIIANGITFLFVIAIVGMKLRFG